MPRDVSFDRSQDEKRTGLNENEALRKVVPDVQIIGAASSDSRFMGKLSPQNRSTLSQPGTAQAAPSTFV